MNRLLVLVEGTTERDFVHKILKPALDSRGVYVSAPRVGHRGGNRWESVRRDLVNILRQDPGVYCSTMFDYYGMGEEWPGRASSKAASPERRAAIVEDAVSARITNSMGESFDKRRFVPYVQMHEFEAMLFSDVAALANAVQRPELTGHFQSILNEFGCPEAINDSEQTHPSQRIKDVVPNYKKVVHGNIAAVKMGLECIRTQCPHLAQWLARLESLQEVIK